MTSNPMPDHILFADLPSPIDEQYRMRKLTVWNWGTFSNLHTIDIAEDGMLLLGPSGAGKSTLLDAISAMIVPPTKIRFNAAAEEGERGGRDRTLMSYIRGAWADRGEEGSREIAKQFLRDGPTWSAIALEYRNRIGRVLTLVRLFWVTGAGTSANINRHFMVVDGEFDLASELKDFDGDRRKLRQRLGRSGIRHHEESFASYQEHWCRVMGIEDSTALELLHKTQSTKSLGDLNSFLREFMLEEPETFEKARLLADEFVNLEEAHRAVVTARRQIEVLSPARTAHAEHVAAIASISDNDALVQAVPAFRYSLEVGLLEDEQTKLVRKRSIAITERGQLTEQLRLIGETIQSLERQRLELGGGSIEELERRIAELTAMRMRRSNDRTRAQRACQALGWQLADDAGGFAAQAEEARALVEASDSRQAGFAAEERALAVKAHERKNEFSDLRKEVTSLEQNPSSIPRRAQEIRTRLCEALNIPTSKVPFVGELIEVREDERETWGPAAEQLLRSFALDLLIDEADDRRVARWVDETNLRGRIVYHPVRTAQQSSPREPQSEDSILHKLQVKPGHPFAPWVRRELAERFDYACVASPAELARGERRITTQGQIRHARRRTVKDDSLNIRDPKNWVLGFDNRDKLARLRQLATDAGAALVETEKALEALDQARRDDSARAREAQILARTEWGDIDVATLAQHIGQLESDLHALRGGNSALDRIEGQLADVRTRQRQNMETLSERNVTIRGIDERMPILETELQRARMEAAGLPSAIKEDLGRRLPDNWTPARAELLETLQKVVTELQQENRRLTTRAASLASVITAAFADFLREWPEEAASVQSTLDFAPDFLARLKRIEEDGLPQHEARFLSLLQTQSTQRLAELSRHLSEAKREIGARLDDVNDALEAVPYNHDSFLEIKTIDLNLPDVRDFNEKLAAIFADQRQQTDDPIGAERRFDALRELVEKLKTEEAWRTIVLDVRRHVQFMAVERERGSGKEIERYGGSSGKSGGQRQKLTATCLAAALRYKLGGVDGGEPSYGAVVLDEAFTKTDNEFTATSMKIFTELGFQMVVATPLKSVMTLEEFVGGATYVSISNRHTSSLLHIAYDRAERRLAWSEKARRTAMQDADAIA